MMDGYHDGMHRHLPRPDSVAVAAVAVNGLPGELILRQAVQNHRVAFSAHFLGSAPDAQAARGRSLPISDTLYISPC